MKSIRFVSFHAIAVSAALGLSAFAAATGPSNQTAQLNREIRVLYGLDAAGNNGNFNGTGTIFDNMNINGQGYFCVVTADHVVSSNGTKAGALFNGLGVGFGNDSATSGLSGLKQVGNVARYGNLGGQDVAVFAVSYGAYNAANDQFVAKLGTPLTQASGPFSEWGFGNTGDFVAGGMNTLNQYGVERFQNNSFTRFMNVAYSGYAYNSIQWTFNAQNGSGNGTSFDGDSGGAYFNGSQQGFTISVNGKIPQNMNAFTDYLVGVHDFGDNNAFKAFGFMGNGGTPMTAGLEAWMQKACMNAVPEPSSMLALALPVAILALRRRRKAA